MSKIEYREICAGIPRLASVSLHLNILSGVLETLFHRRGNRYLNKAHSLRGRFILENANIEEALGCHEHRSLPYPANRMHGSEGHVGGQELPQKER